MSVKLVSTIVKRMKNAKTYRTVSDVKNSVQEDFKRQLKEIVSVRTQVAQPEKVFFKVVSLKMSLIWADYDKEGFLYFYIRLSKHIVRSWIHILLAYRLCSKCTSNITSEDFIMAFLICLLISRHRRMFPAEDTTLPQRLELCQHFRELSLWIQLSRWI